MKMIEDGVVKFVCILKFNILASPTILTVGDEVECLFHVGRQRSTYRIDSQPICMYINFAFSALS